MLGAVAEYERSLIRLRLRNGRRRKHERGGYAGYGSPQLGWRAVDGELVPAAAEAAAIARIRELCEGGASVRAIGAALTAEGHAPKKGGRWHPETIRRVLSRAA